MAGPGSAGGRWAHTREVRVEPAVAEWLVESSGYARARLARRMGVRTNVLERWIRTGRGMTWNTIERLARCLRRPSTAFLLREPARGRPLADCRGGVVSGTPGAMAPALSPEDIFAVRMARYRQSEAGEMLYALKGTDAGARGNTPGATVDDPPDDVAEREMRRLGLPTQLAEPGAAEAPFRFEQARDALERHADVLVFQGAMDADSVRSVVLAPVSYDEWEDKWRPPPSPRAIVVNAKDAEATRTFSLLHAYGHVLLGFDGSSRGGCICKEDGFHRRSWPAPDRDRTEDERAEEWCDSLAAAALMPHAAFMREIERAERDMALKRYDMEWDGPAGTRTAAGLLSEMFGTTPYAVAVRAIDMPQTMKQGRYRRLVAETANARCNGGGRPARIKKGGDAGAYCLSRFGRRFVRTVLSAHDTGEATVQDVIELLDIRLDDVDDVRGAV